MTVEKLRTPASETSGPTRAHLWTLVIISGAQLMLTLDATIMFVALPSAQRTLGFSDIDRQWVITAYTLGFGGLLLLGGRIGDMVGPKRTLIVGAVGFAVASALGGASPTIAMLIGARAVQGVFGALLAPSILSLLSTTFTNPRDRGRAFGIYATIAVGGAAFGLVLGGFLTQYLSWRWCMYVNLPIAAVVAYGAITMIPNRSRRSGIRLDIPGAILGCGGLVALVYALGEAGSIGWSSSRVIGPLIAAAVLLASFGWLQVKVSNPLLPLRIVTNRNRGGALLGIILAQLAMFGTLLFITYLLQTVDHYSPLKTGVCFLPLMVMNGLTATRISSRLMAHVHSRLLIVPGFLVAAVGAGLLTQLTPNAPYVSYVLPAELLLGFGLGLAVVPCVSTASRTAEPRDAGITAATTNTAQQVGASIGTSLLNTIAAAATATYLASRVTSAHVRAQATVHGFAVASSWAAGSFVLAALIAGILVDAHPGRPTGPLDLAKSE